MDFRLGKDQQHFAELGQKFLLNKFLDLCRKVILIILFNTKLFLEKYS